MVWYVPASEKLYIYFGGHPSDTNEILTPIEMIDFCINKTVIQLVTNLRILIIIECAARTITKKALNINGFLLSKKTII